MPDQTTGIEVPEKAKEAAWRAFSDGPLDSRPALESALAAALPYIEASIRESVAYKLRSRASAIVSHHQGEVEASEQLWEAADEIAALSGEEGADRD